MRTTRRARNVGLVIGLFWSCIWLIWLVPGFFDALNLDRPMLRYALAAAVVAFAGCCVAHFIARSAICVASGVGLTIAMVVAPGWSFDFAFAGREGSPICIGLRRWMVL